MKKKKDKPKKRKGFLTVLIFFIVWTLWSWVPVTERIELELLKDSGTGVRIALITDLHSCYYGKNQNWLIRRIDKEHPDIILLAGDCETVTINGSTLDICGVDDPNDLTMEQWTKQIDEAFSKTDESHVRILVSHRPEKVDVYEKYDFDLVVCGHAHAGQIRIPFLNKGVYAPDQGLMAEYVNGTYTLSNGSIMEVSRGLARESTIAPRFFNHPEVVIIELK